MENKIADGGTVPYANASGSTIASGAVVAFGNTIGIAVADIPTGTTGTLQVQGRFTVPKVSGAVFVAGEKLIWDASAGAFDDSAATPASGDITGGVVAVSAGTNGQTTADVLLTPGNTTRTA